MENYIVLDLEMCKVKRKGIKHEIIQIGAIHMDEDFNVIEMFNTYVKPEIGALDTFITGLTGITYENIVNAPTFTNALDLFHEWLPKDNITFVTWSGSDEHQIRKECAFKQIDIEWINSEDFKWEDAQKLFRVRLEERRDYSLSEALYIADIVFAGREHNGLDDAFNTALLYKKLKVENELKLNKYYESAKSEVVEDLSFSLGSLMLNLGV